jgi:hypothetical protein
VILRQGFTLAALLLALPQVTFAGSAGAEHPMRVVPRSPPRAQSTPTLDFSEFYHFGPRAPEPTAKLLSFAGKRVTLVGFMVLLEAPVIGGFYLAPYPAASDESGSGRGDVPPTAVLVLPRAAKGKAVEFVPGPLEITGTLQVGNEETAGESASVRLLVDDLRRFRFARIRSTASGVRTPTKHK